MAVISTVSTAKGASTEPSKQILTIALWCFNYIAQSLGVYIRVHRKCMHSITNTMDANAREYASVLGLRRPSMYATITAYILIDHLSAPGNVGIDSFAVSRDAYQILVAVCTLINTPHLQGRLGLNCYRSDLTKAVSSPRGHGA